MAPSRIIRRDLSIIPGSNFAAMEAVGGLWVAAHPAIAMTDVLAAAHDRGVRALELRDLTADLAIQLPDLEFLVLADPYPDARYLAGLDRLRYLDIGDAWLSRLDLGWFPQLEWLFLGDPTEAQARSVIADLPRSEALAHLWLGRYPFADLEPLAGLALRRLGISRAPRLATLAAAGTTLAHGLRGLALSTCSGLTDLEGLAGFEHLESLTLSDLRRTTSVDQVRELRQLRFLDVHELKGLDSLAPLAGHPTLEFVMVGPTRDLDLEPLATIPGLRLTWIGPGRWNRDPKIFPRVGQPDTDKAAERVLRALQYG